MKNNMKKNNLIKWIVFALFLIVSATIFDSDFLSEKQKDLSYSSFIKSVEKDEVKNVLLATKSPKLMGATKEGKIFKTTAPNDSNMIEKLLKNNVEINVASDSDSIGWLASIIHWIPMLLLVGLIIYASRQMQSGRGGAGGALGIGKAKTKMFQPKKINITFKDVAGIDEAKQELEEVIDFLKAPQKFQRLGGKIPRGVLLVGDPGNGKTLLAKAIAGEASVPFFSISGSDFVEVFVGVGASRVRDMFENAKKHAPCIVFIDEIDAIGKRRDGSARNGGNDEREQTLNQLLVEMDGFEESQGVIILAATNRSDVLDPALLRPGRFDRRIVVQYPDMCGREKILNVHIKNVPVAPDVDLKTVARGTPGFSGAELANLVNEAALFAARSNKLSVTMKDFEIAKDKVMMGTARKSMSMTEEEKKFTAYHEAGHALVALLVPKSDPIHKVTIVPHGSALGMVVRLPEKDKISVSKSELLSNIKVAMGGRVAEEIAFGDSNITTGASSDIKQATNIAKQMIINWGMSEKLGFRSFYDSNGYYFDAGDQVSQKMAETIDSEINDIISTSYKVVKDLIAEHQDKLEKIATKLIEMETLTGRDVQKIFNNEEIDSVIEFADPAKEFALGGLPNNIDEQND